MQPVEWFWMSHIIIFREEKVEAAVEAVAELCFSLTRRLPPPLTNNLMVHIELLAVSRVLSRTQPFTQVMMGWMVLFGRH